METPAGLDENIRLRSASDIVVKLDHDNNGSAQFVVENYAGTDYLTVSEDGTVSVFGGRLLFQPAGTFDAEVVVAPGNNYAGELWLRAETGAGARAGLLVLEEEDGTPHYLWVDTSGNLRVHTSDPGTDDTLGVAVGSQ